MKVQRALKFRDTIGPRGVNNLRVSAAQSKALCVVNAVGLGASFYLRTLKGIFKAAPSILLASRNTHNVYQAVSALAVCEAALLAPLGICRPFKTQV